MTRFLLLLFLLFTLPQARADSLSCPPAPLQTPPPALLREPKVEARAVWLTTLYGLDWPKTPATGEAGRLRQQEELCRLLDRLQEAGINCVFFQTRMRNDLAYPSGIEPLSPVFGGAPGRSPGYDPLLFCIEECHKRGMECHAWIVTLPLGTAQEQKALGRQALSRQGYPFVVRADGRYYIDPGYPEAGEYLASLVAEITDRYDIDGIQFDYFRYPENISFPDQRSYRKYGSGLPRSLWRENNLTALLRRLRQTVKEKKPWVKISICPLGKYDGLPRYDAGGFTAKRHHQDAKKWLSEGLLDWVCPMLYYRGDNFYPFLADWLETASGERPVIPGLGIYFLDPREGDWDIGEVLRQISYGRSTGCAGIGYYRAEFLVRDLQGLKSEVERRFSLYPALLPPMTWASGETPAPPRALRVEYEGQHTLISWEAAPSAGPSAACTYNLYASDTWPVDISRAENLVAVRIEATRYEYDATLLPPRRYFAVASYDRYNRESTPLQMERPMEWEKNPHSAGHLSVEK